MMETSDACIFCDSAPCECEDAKPKKKAGPKRKKSPPPTGADAGTARPETPIKKPAQSRASDRVRPEHKQKASARPERDRSNLIDTVKRDRSKEAETFWLAMRNLVNEGMVHEISVKRALNAYPSIPEGIYGEQ